MDNEEVGFFPEESDFQGESIYILPRLEGVPLEDSDLVENSGDGIRLFVLPDGNNRASLDGKSYDDGGKNVIKIAEVLANRNDVAMMVACLMSPENIEKRGSGFFQKVYRAFVGLGVNIATDSTLVKDGIKLETYGDLDVLRARGVVAGELADIIQAVCDMTSCIDDPSLRLVFGVNYPPSTLLDLNVDAIFRSGMDDVDGGHTVFRSSGLDLDPKIVSFSSTQLWPYVESDEICSVLDSVNGVADRRFLRGYSYEEIMEMVQSFSESDFSDMVSIIIPYDVDGSSSGFRSESDDFESDRVCLVPWNDDFEHSVTYSAFLAPGQDGSRGFVLPENPQLGYANVFSCGGSLEDISIAVQRAFDYSRNSEVLKGAERVIEKVTELVPERNHFTEVFSLIDGFDDSMSCIDVAHELVRLGKISEDSDIYNLSADIFVARLLKKIEPLCIPQSSAEQFRALMNYLYTAFFIAGPSRSALNNGVMPDRWEERAELYAMNCVCVYGMDEEVFDILLPDETASVRQERLSQSAQCLVASVNNDVFDGEIETPDVHAKISLKGVSEFWHKTIAKYSNANHPLLLKGFKGAFTRLYSDSVSEYEEGVMEDCVSLLDQIAVVGLTGDVVKQLLQLDYVANAPDVLRVRIQELLTAIEEKKDDDVVRIEDCTALRELRLLLHILKINTMAVELFYRTATLTFSSDDVDDNVIKLFDDICIIADSTYRIANDIAGFFKVTGESDSKVDCCSLMIDPYLESESKGVAAIKGISELKLIYKSLKNQFDIKLNQLYRSSPLLGSIVLRGIIGFKVYEAGHYKDLSREQMLQLMQDFDDELLTNG